MTAWPNQLWRWMRDHVLADVVVGLLILAAPFVGKYGWDHRRKSVPLWLVVLGIAVVGGGAVLLHVYRHRSIRERAIEYATHVQEILRQLGYSSSDPNPVPWREVIDKAILGPALGFFAPRIDGTRFMLQVPENDQWKALTYYAGAGHSLNTQQGFRLEIAGTIAEVVVREKKTIYLGNVDKDERFKRHPKAREERRYTSLYCAPILVNDEVVAVFSVTSKPERAFDELDEEYLELLTAVLEMTAAMGGIPSTAPAGTVGQP